MLKSIIFLCERYTAFLLQLRSYLLFFPSLSLSLKHIKKTSLQGKFIWLIQPKDVSNDVSLLCQVVTLGLGSQTLTAPLRQRHPHEERGHQVHQHRTMIMRIPSATVLKKLDEVVHRLWGASLTCACLASRSPLLSFCHLVTFAVKNRAPPQ